MLEVIVAAKYTNMLFVCSACLNFGYGHCGSLCIIDASKDSVVKTILEIDGTVPTTIETIKI